MIQEITAAETITDGMSKAGRVAKRLFDMVASLLLLLLLSPVFLIISLLIRREHTGPVFYCQERIGFRGHPFVIYKFRTMCEGFEREGFPLLSCHGDESQTPLERFLRDHHLDELPQLWNILIGDMSFVGPRPERRFFIDQIMKHNSDYQYIYLMRPGLTSMATIHNGYTDTMEKMLVRLQMDLQYLKTRSLWMDIRIMCTTAKYILYGKKI